MIVNVNELTGPDLDAAVALHVFGDDLSANTDERIRDACVSWRLQTYKGSDLYSSPLWEEFGRDIKSGKEVDPDRTLAGFAWRNRDGKPWQADLEAHVAAYRATPPPYSSDLNLCMTDVWPKALGEGWQIYDLGEFHVFRTVPGIAGVDADLPTAICRAAILASLEKETK